MCIICKLRNLNAVFPLQWYLQLLKTKDYHGTTELKLGGCPWWADGNDAVEARYFISSLVGTLKSNGWEVCGTIDLSRHNNDKSTLLLKQCRPSFAPHMCVSFNKSNRIRLIVSRYVPIYFITGRSLSEAIIFASTNPQYDDRMLIELRVQYMKIQSSEHVKNMLCTQSVFCFYIQDNLCTQHVLDMFWAWNFYVLNF